MENIILNKKKILFVVVILITTIKTPITSNIINHHLKNNLSQEYARIVIPKIDINQELYKINDKKNNVDENITILRESILPNKKNSIVFIAAHSGEGKIAYFERLDELSINDQITLIFNNKKYIYEVIDIWEEKKNGYITVNKEIKRQLVLTTCSPTKKEYQLIVNCTEKESSN